MTNIIKNLKKVTAEEIGIKSEYVQEFLDELERHQLCMHGFLLMRHEKIGAEGYWKPMTQEEPHRMYSATKSFVAAAIGVLADEGKISLDDRIIDYFPDLLPKEGPHPYLACTTIRNLLMMSTCYTKSTYDINMTDWLKSYFNAIPDHPSGTIFNYDSCGTYVLGALVKRVTGQDFLEYLMEKVLLKIGFSSERKCLEGPDGELWAGSGLLITLRELAAFAKLLLDGGRAGSEQLISEEYVKAATTKQITNRTDLGSHNYYDCGYGYQIWILRDDAFYLYGAGGQKAICFPKTGLIFACTADIQGRLDGNVLIYEALWNKIVSRLEEPMPVSERSSERLEKRCRELTMKPIEGEAYSVIQEKINGIEYELNKNTMGIRELRVDFAEGRGILTYSTPRGEKSLTFGMAKYLEDRFPETHYPGQRLRCPAGREYRCLNCGAWVQENILVIRTNIIDEFVGNLMIVLSFDKDKITVAMEKSAQFFLDEYQGIAGGKMKVEREN